MVRQSLPPIEEWPSHAQGQGWRVAKLARHFGVSPDTLRRVFEQKRNGDGPLKGWLQALRMKQACALVQTLTVKETAASLGYASADAFCHAFTHFHGSAPTARAARAEQNGNSGKPHLKCGKKSRIAA